MKNSNVLLLSGAAALLFFFSCSIRQQETTPSSFCPRANTSLQQKAIALQKKLDLARHTLSEDEKTVDRIRMQLFDAELNAIESKIAHFEIQWHKNPQKTIQTIKQPDFSKFFFEERETLNQIIHVGGIHQQRAQTLLDRVLALITQLSDSR